MLQEERRTSSYGGTSAPTKGLVAGLTGVVNGVFALLGGDADAAVEAAPKRGVIEPSALLDGVRADYEERMYLWTGEIDPNLYDDECTFTDPTLSFTGLATFQRNLAALQPVLRFLVRSPLVELYSIEMSKATSTINATWRMYAELRLPWRPAIDLRGSTRFTYDAERAGGRITEYVESWELEAGTALMQILTPAARRKEGSSGGERG